MNVKRLKSYFFAKLNLLLGALLSLLGFGSCGDSPWNEVCEYGQPYAKYDVKGAVLSDAGQKLEGMDVTIKQIQRYSDVEFVGEIRQVCTDAQGEYRHKGKWWGSGSDISLRVVVEDPQGVYAADSADVTLTSTTEGKGDWCIGTDVGTANFSLERLSPNE